MFRGLNAINVRLNKYFPVHYSFFPIDANETNYWVNVLGVASNDGIVGYVVPISAASNGVSQCAY